MYLIEFEECVKDNQKQTAVRILDPAADDKYAQIIAETMYLGSPPGLCFQTGETFSLLRVPRSRQK